jgi:hypothetical protein
MAYAIDWKKILILAALLLAPLALTNCGSAVNNAATSNVGPKGPTYPNKLYFDLTATSSVAQSGGSVTFSVRVWDSLGNMVENVSVIFSGGGTWTSATVTTDGSGIANGALTVSGAGTISYVTVTVENMSLTIPVQIIASTAAAA